MVLKRTVDNALADQCGNGDNGAELQRELVLSGPYLTEENIVIELGKFWRELAEFIPTGSLLYFLGHYSFSSLIIGVIAGISCVAKWGTSQSINGRQHQNKCFLHGYSAPKRFFRADMPVQGMKYGQSHLPARRRVRKFVRNLSSRGIQAILHNAC